MALNPNAASFVPSYASWGAPPPPAPTVDKEYYDEYEEEPYDPNYYPSEDYDGEDEISELLAEIERMQLEADMTRELETLKAQGRSDEADLWNKWMTGAATAQDYTYVEESASKLPTQQYSSVQHHRQDYPQHNKKATPNPYSYNSRNYYSQNTAHNSSPKHQPQHRTTNYTNRAIYQPRATN